MTELQEDCREIIRAKLRVARKLPFSIASDLNRTESTVTVNYIDVSEVMAAMEHELIKLTRQKDAAISLLKYFVDYGCTYPFADQPKKQKFIDDHLKTNFPEVNWPIMYKDLK